MTCGTSTIAEGMDEQLVIIDIPQVTIILVSRSSGTHNENGSELILVGHHYICAILGMPSRSLLADEQSNKCVFPYKEIISGSPVTSITHREVVHSAIFLADINFFTKMSESTSPVQSSGPITVQS